MKLNTLLLFIFFGNFNAMNMLPSAANCVVSEFKISATEKMYLKEYFDNGIVKAEGWSILNTKTDYWKFYNVDGTLSSEGSFSNNKKNGYWHYYNHNGALIKEGHYHNGIAHNWWIFYDIADGNKSKFQYENNVKNGFALHYEKKKLTKAEKYKDNEKMGEWTSVWAFRRDNPNATF